MYFRTVRRDFVFDFATAKELGLNVYTLNGTDTVLPRPSGPTQQEIDSAIETVRASLGDSAAQLDPQYADWQPPADTCPPGDRNYVIKRLDPKYINSWFVTSDAHHFGPLLNEVTCSSQLPTSGPNYVFGNLVASGIWDQSPPELLAATEQQANTYHRFRIGAIYLPGQMAGEVATLNDISGLGHLKGGALGGSQGATVWPRFTHLQWRPVAATQSTLRALNGVSISAHPTARSSRPYSFSVMWLRLSPVFGWVRDQGSTFASSWDYTPGGLLASVLVDSSPAAVDLQPVPDADFNITDFRVTVE
jgi:hypothetical protein